MTKATSQRGVTYNYNYDLTGRPITLEAKSSTGDASVFSTAEYTTNKDFISEVTDQNGNEVTYEYDTAKGVLNKTTDNTGTVTRTYHAENDTLQTMSKELTEDGYTVKTDFYYTDGGDISKIVNNGTNYNMAYDDFNNMISAIIGNQTIKTNTFGKNNGLLQKTTYGNGNYETFTYDSFNNVNSHGFDGTLAFKWFSDKTGAPTRHQDLINQIQYDYDYDVTSRLVRENAINTASKKTLYLLKYGYDQNNNISKLVNITDKKLTKTNIHLGRIICQINTR